MVVGCVDKKYISALIVPSFVQLTEKKKKNGVVVLSNEELIKDKQVLSLLDNEIKKFNDNFGQWEQIKKFVALPNEWSVESGELTPTMKPKRKIIAERYSKEINSIYAAD